ncbi:hypothetical protein POUND7_009537 [Theobroma cacao]
MAQNGAAGNNGGGAGAATNNTVEAPQPNSVKEQLPGIQYCINSPPPWPEAIVLGFQHYLLTLGINVLIPSIIVPQMGGGNAEKATVTQNLLFVSGLSTFFQSLFGTQLPTLLLSPLSVVPYVTFTGLGLHHLGFPMVAKCVEVGLTGIIIMAFISQYLPCYIESKQPIFDRFVVLISVAITWLFAQLLTSTTVYKHKPENTQISCRTDPAGFISTAPWWDYENWIYIPCPFQWGSPTFNAGEAFVIMAPAFVSLSESTGTFFAAARYGSAPPVPPSVISSGTGWLGVRVLPNGLLSSVTGTTASVENVGLLAMTRVGSRRVIQVSDGFMIFFSAFAFSNSFSDIVLVIFMSHTTVAALVALFFDSTLSRENDETKKDSGLKWWEKFSSYKSDVRNDEFYALPCRLNKLFPAL